ncbi:hypothetical protein R3X27_11175 [Tropicimonas sp. TH_r6]|uniref:hypothetical protein n=1 Tax=Tropicimonas sp. TH_r6 TaxID=3082085 RepID=UPI002955543B|nr:hypothetical protein [Tropicimonas sp. TH_r6]MDV7143243.1 hypothetical protein [Tropicimonas sp. TH_r6]
MRTSAPIRDLKAFGALSKADQKLRDEAWSPGGVTVSDSCPDADAGDDLQIRADFLRYVICKGYGEEKGPLAASPDQGEKKGLAEPGESQLDCFQRQPEAKRYPQFNPLVYSADTLLPVVALEMQEFWIPDEKAGNWGCSARWFLWAQILAGWALSLLAVAGFSGLIKSD